MAKAGAGCAGIPPSIETEPRWWDRVTEKQAYRIYFCITGRSRTWLRGWKRSIRWVFGQLGNGIVEHDIELRWAKKKGKAKLFWNSKDVTAFVHTTESRSQHELSWRLPTTREILRVVVQKQTRGLAERDRYSLFVGRVNFGALPTLRELGSSTAATCTTSERRSPTNDEVRGGGEEQESDCSSNPFAEPPPITGNSLGFRLSMAGLGRSASSGDPEVVDELHSDLYSPLLEDFRARVLEALPEAEEVVSRSIVNAFFDNYPEESLCDDSLSTFDDGLIDHHALEAKQVKDAVGWLRDNSELQHRREWKKLKLEFLQHSITDILLGVRHEHLQPDQASRIIISVATVLGLKVASSCPTRMLVLDGLNGTVTESTLHCLLSADHGMEISFLHAGIAVCFFESEAGLASGLQGIVGDVLRVYPTGLTIVSLPQRRVEPEPPMPTFATPKSESKAIKTMLSPVSVLEAQQLDAAGLRRNLQFDIDERSPSERFGSCCGE